MLNRTKRKLAFSGGVLIIPTIAAVSLIIKKSWGSEALGYVGIALLAITICSLLGLLTQNILGDIHNWDPHHDPDDEKRRCVFCERLMKERGPSTESPAATFRIFGMKFWGAKRDVCGRCLTGLGNLLRRDAVEQKLLLMNQGK